MWNGCLKDEAGTFSTNDQEEMKKRIEDEIHTHFSQDSLGDDKKSQKKA